MNKKRKARVLELISTRRLTPNMQRITLGGLDMADFPQGHESANFKLLLPRPGQDAPRIEPEDGNLPDDEKPIVRTYTLRKFDPSSMELTVDFAIHENPGPATRWALSAQPGDKVGFRGPGAPKLLNPDADWVLLAGDMSALPAIGALLEGLPADTRGHVVVEILSEEDRQQLQCPTGIEQHWLINPAPNLANEVLSSAVKKLPWSEGKPGVWIAGESASARELRQYCKQERTVDRDFLYASGYWQIGLNEDRHQQVKRQQAN